MGNGAEAIVSDTPTARWATAQPWRGILTVLISVGITVAIAANFKLDGWLGWFTVWGNSLVPMQVVIALAWGAQYPPVQKLDQPWRGIELTLLQVMVGSITALLLLKFVGGGGANPVVNVFTISSVLTTFFLVIAFGCWPFHRLSTPAKGFLTLLLVYPVMAILFRTYNFSDLVKTIPPLASVAPTGPIPWDMALSFYFVMFGFLFVFVTMDMWPLYKVPGVMKQPVMGVALVILCGALAALSFVVLFGFGVKPFDIMLGFLCFVAGVLTTVIALQGWPARSLPQPAKGFLNLLFSGAVAWVLYKFFYAFAVSHFGAGPMGTYPLYLMVIGNFMLALTFPLYVVHSVFFDGWPLPATAAPKEG
ncbi:MAG: hypothetical protein A4E65_00135 [Syntrophorhabdus sp. PtaU1.Bin153]|nr:MAG: hypothetical protein A4E65_00135 [Syntrophorhabdus sp. PtaU1.Bin153]